MPVTYWARINSPSANNKEINLVGTESAIEVTFVATDINGAPGDLVLDSPDVNGDGTNEIDPDTVIIYNGQTYQFSIEASGTMPSGKADNGDKVPAELEGQQTVIIRIYDSNGVLVDRLVIVLDTADGDAPTQLEMDGLDQGNITMVVDPTDPDIPVCFVRGGLVATPQGPVAVEALNVGDQVLTASGAVARVRFVASREVAAAELFFRPEMRPVCIPAGAMGEGLPKADLWVSPQHRVLVRGWEVEMLFGEPEVLVAAKHLKIAAPRLAMPETVEYFHLMLDHHDIVLSNGIETESLFPGDTAIASLTDEARAGMERAFPEFAGDWTFYGPTARRTLTAKEAEALWTKMAPLGAEAVRDVA